MRVPRWNEHKISGVVALRRAHLHGISHPELRAPRDHRHVLRRWMPVNRNLVSVRQVESQHELPWTERIAMQHADLSARREARRRKIAPRERVSGSADEIRRLG